MATSGSAGANPNGVRSHFWVATFPFFETTIFIAPAIGVPPSTPTRVRLFDADGGLVNDATVEVEPGRVGVFELEQLFGSAKLESGFRHGYLEVESPVGTRHLCRLHNRSGGVFYPEASELSAARTVFSPVSFASGFDQVVCLVNHSEVPGVVKIRLLVGKRTPETFVEVPPHGARLVSLGAEFGAYIGAVGHEPTPGYVRISAKGEGRLGVQLLQRVQSRDERADGDVFAVVS